MNKQDVQKNFELAGEFNHYVVKHPEVVRSVGRRASIVMIKPSDKRLTAKNLELARTLKKERRVVYLASQIGARWEVTRFKNERAKSTR
jgi:hypothetical protein